MYDIIYLCKCVVNNTVPNKEIIENINLEDLFNAAKKHSLTAMVAYALESAGIKSHAFQQAKAKAIRKIAVMEIDKKLLFKRMDEAGIWYTPLKGVVIKDLYPFIGMRQMADFDILFDKKYAEQVRDIFLSLGFICEDFGRLHHDVYFKQPVSNFEMHKTLFRKTHKSELYNYYRHIEDRLIKDADNSFGYHLSINDFYIYVTAHEYKHFSNGGTGLRSILDTYVIWQKLGNKLDKDYIKAECTKLDISDFEQKNKQLALHLFGNDTLTEEDKNILDYIIFSGTYGTMEHRFENDVRKYGRGKKGKFKVIFKKLFLPMNVIQEKYPVVYRHKILLPGLFFYRIGEAVTIKKRETLSKLKIILKIK